MHKPVVVASKHIALITLLLLSGCGSDTYSVQWRAVVEADETRTGWFPLIFAPTYSSHKDCYRMIAPANPGKKVVCLPFGKSYWAVRWQNAYAGDSRYTHCIARTPSEDMYWPNLVPLKAVSAADSGDDWYCDD
jgi:hypothetical protein